jgi:hypothetical protein
MTTKIYRYLYDHDNSRGLKAAHDAKIASTAWPPPDIDYLGREGWWIGVGRLADGFATSSNPKWPNQQYNHTEFYSGTMIGGEEVVPKKTVDDFEYNYKPAYGKGVYLAGISITGDTTTGEPIEGLDCEFLLNFDEDTVLNSNDGTLTVGMLETSNTGHTLTGYVIHWYHQDDLITPYFSSGYGVGDYMIQHPFIGDGSFPVQSGIWYPKIVYIDVDGERYVPVENEMGYCELPEFTVNPFGCNSGSNLIGDYTHRVFYNFTPETADVSLNVVDYALSIDGGATIVAFYFDAETIPERITAYYVQNGVETQLWDGVVGASSYITQNYNTSPLYITNFAKVLLDLSPFTYVVGDLIRFKIDPSYGYKDEVRNTNWQLDIVCLDSFNCLNIVGNPRQLSGSTLSLIDANICRYELSLTMGGYVENFENDDLGDYSRTYLEPSQNTITPNTFYTNTGSHQIDNASTTSAYEYDPGGTCFQGDDYMWFKKIGNTFTLEFSGTTGLDHFNIYKTRYDTILANADFSNWSSDPQNINYYKRFEIRRWVEQEECGDAYSSQIVALYFHIPTSVWTFEEGPNPKITISVEKIGDINGNVEYSGSGCTDLTIIQNLVDSINNTVDVLDFEKKTKTANVGVLGGIPLLGYYCYLSTDIDFNVLVYKRISTYKNLGVENACNLSSPQWCMAGVDTGGPAHYYYLYAFRFFVTDEQDPENNYRLYQALDTTTGCLLPTNQQTTIVYEIINGVVQ